MLQSPDSQLKISLNHGRLSEDPEVTVGVLEAGERHEDVDGITIPGTTHFSSHSSGWLFSYNPLNRIDRHHFGRSAVRLGLRVRPAETRQ